MVAAAPHGSMQVCHCSKPLRDGLPAYYMDAILAMLLAHNIRTQSHLVLQYILQAPVVMQDCSNMRACCSRVAHPVTESSMERSDHMNPLRGTPGYQMLTPPK